MTLPSGQANTPSLMMTVVVMIMNMIRMMAMIMMILIMGVMIMNIITNTEYIKECSIFILLLFLPNIYEV